MQGSCQKEGGFRSRWLLCTSHDETFKYNHFGWKKKHISSRISLLRNTKIEARVGSRCHTPPSVLQLSTKSAAPLLHCRAGLSKNRRFKGWLLRVWKPKPSSSVVLFHLWIGSHFPDVVFEPKLSPLKYFPLSPFLSASWFPVNDEASEAGILPVWARP